MNNYYAICGFLSGGILVYLFNNYKINNLEKKIKELEETNMNLIEHLMFLDSTPHNSTPHNSTSHNSTSHNSISHNSTYKKNIIKYNDFYYNYKINSEDNFIE